MSVHDDTTGVILAGGSATRFGGDKALAMVQGEAIISRVRLALEAVFPRVIVVGGSEAVRAHLAGVEAFADDVPGIGPMGGVATALRRIETPRAFCAACDMPFLDTALVAEVVALAADADAACPRVGDRPEPLHACYHRRCRRAVRELIARGEYRMSALLASVRTAYLDLAEDDPRARSLRSVNTPEDLMSAQEGDWC
jgi:molybdopterin-guanine dinucleotide biosynthesis protein A